MSDSLKDQLLQAGFKASKPSPPRAKKPKHKIAAKKKSAVAKEASKVAEKRRVKAAIVQLLNEAKPIKSQGEQVYHYRLGNRIRQLFVNEDTHSKLCAGELYVTRLNGETRLISPELASAVLALNPNWVIVQPSDKDDSANTDDDYKNFPVPDDLKW